MTAVRRARPALGTLVELGADPGPAAGAAAGAFAAGWRAIAGAEAAMSAFLPASDVARFNGAPAGARIALQPGTAAVLCAARALQASTGGLFDVTAGTGPEGWALEGRGRARALRKLEAGTRLDLGGIAKGYAVDLALEAMAAALAGGGARVACWVNAGGDLRVRGLEVPVHLRDERRGGARPWLILREGALATSDFGATPGRLAGGPARARQVSVLSPRCLWSDALTKVVALAGRTDHPAVRARGARAWIHE